MRIAGFLPSLPLPLPPRRSILHTLRHIPRLTMSVWRSAAVTIAYQAVFGTIAFSRRIDTLTDFAGTTNALVLALLSYFTSSHSPRQFAVCSFVAVWATRLGAFLLRRILQWGEDRRLDNIRHQPRSAFLFWSVQALWIWTITLPMVMVCAQPVQPPLTSVDYLGWALYAVGLTTESVADWQKLRASASLKWMNVGLWRFSRHPNYFGEILVWTAVYVSSMSALSQWQHVAVVSPVFTACLLLFLSGVPMLENSADRKYAHDEQYVAYKRRTSVLVPLPTSVYTRLPPWFKKTFLFDFDMYDNVPKYQALQRQQQYDSVSSTDN